MKLTGDRNECPGCGQFFNSSFAFDKHRVGEHGRNRCCLPVAEMQAKGMEKNDAGFWVGSRMPGIYFSTPMDEGEEAYIEANRVRFG